MRLRDFRNWWAHFAYYGLSPAQHETFLAAVPQVVGSEPLTREQLASPLASRTGIPHVRDVILTSSWGSLLRQSSIRGDLCFWPNQGQTVTFVNPRAWSAACRSVE